MGTNLNAVPDDWDNTDLADTQASLSGTPGVPSSTEKKLAFGEYSLSIDEVFRDIKRLTLSKNPLDLIFKANEIREKFAFFINSLAAFISESFSFENKSFSDEIYHDARYHEVWMELVEPFLRDIRYCDPFVGDLQNTETLTPIDPAELARKMDSDTLGDEDFASVKIVIEHIIRTYRTKDAIDDEFRAYIKAKAPHTDGDFTRSSITLGKKESFFEAVNEIIALIGDFPYTKEVFLGRSAVIIERHALSTEETKRVYAYVFQRIVDLHYPDVRHIFFDTNLPYGSNQTFLNKRAWLQIKGKSELKIENISTPENKQYFSHILNCKSLILELQTNILSPILLPIILKLMASSMSLRRKDFKKFSYILLFLFANTYENEYIPLSRFLNELEVYINYKNENRGLEKLKIGFALIILFALFVFLGYFLLPTFVFIA